MCHLSLTLPISEPVRLFSRAAALPTFHGGIAVMMGIVHRDSEIYRIDEPFVVFMPITMLH